VTTHEFGSLARNENKFSCGLAAKYKSMRYLKKLGQIFLINKKALKKIAEALEIKKGETIIEIGAGTGNLTGEILKKTGKLIAIEKDSRMAEILKKKFPIFPPEARLAKGGNFQFSTPQIIQGDIRDVLPEITEKFKNYKVVGNIPYYLTGRLLRIFQELKNPPKSIVLTLQKEVAERVAAQAPKMNKLSAIINLWAKPKILFHLKPTDFYPAPKVSSSVIKLEVLPLKKRLKNEELIIQLIKIGSHQPRKTLLNNLSRIFPKNNLKNAFYELNLGDKTRPDDLNRDLWIKLAKALHHF